MTDGTAAGGVLACNQGVLRGWAEPDASGDPAIVELVAEGCVIADAVADQPNGADGRLGFTLLAEARHRPPDALAVLVRVRGGQTLSDAAILLQPDDFQHQPPAPIVWPPLPWRLSEERLYGFIDAVGPAGLHGWAQDRRNLSTHVMLHLREGGIDHATVQSDVWREDLEETRQGDGRWGISAALPSSLRDGRLHRLAFLLEDGTPALPHGIIVRLPKADITAPAMPPHAAPSYCSRPAREAGPDIVFTIIAVFYNMHREAARTLTSLTRAYQREIGALGYEVLCVDNGSAPPLDPDWVAAFGPEFRLLQPAPHPSPCRAINAAASQAKGRHLAIMIDGAHLLSPGVLREAWDAVTEAPEAIVALRQWFVGGDQRWLAMAGYRREDEDILFDRIAWPSDGYRVFEVSAPVWESPNCWLDGMIESNCLFVPAAIFDRIGGLDERFDEPGAGYANLDLFQRAAAASPEPITALLGEASFHQFHEGTTTNVSTAIKEARVRTYHNRYVGVHAKPYVGADPIHMRVRGQIRTLRALFSRQRPASPARLGVTDRIRPGSLPLHFDEYAQEYLQSTYVECGLHEEPRWLGHPLGIAPTDAFQIQDLLVRLRPDCVVAVNARPGLLALTDAVLRAVSPRAPRIIAVGNVPDDALFASIVRIAGTAADPLTQACARHTVGPAACVLVLFAPDDADVLPVQALRAFASLVTLRSYIVFLGTALGQPWLGYSRRWYRTAIQMFLDHAAFVVDTQCTRQLLTTSPMGYLQRIEPPAPLAGAMEILAEID